MVTAYYIDKSNLNEKQKKELGKMAIKLPIAVSEALQKPMDRKQFLKTAGAAGLLVVGAGMVIESATGVSKLIASSDDSPRGRSGSSVVGYGNSVYGAARM